MYYVDIHYHSLYVLTDDYGGNIVLTCVRNLAPKHVFVETHVSRNSLDRLYKRIPRLRALLLGVPNV